MSFDTVVAGNGKTEMPVRGNTEVASAPFQNALHVVPAQEASSVYKKVSNYDPVAHKESLDELNQGHLTVKPVFPESSSSAQPGFMARVENNLSEIGKGEEDRWSRVFHGKGSGYDDSVVACEAGMALFTASGVGVVAAMGSFALLPGEIAGAGLIAGGVLSMGGIMSFDFTAPDGE